MTVHIEVDNAAAVVTLAWTAKRNAVGPAEAEALTDALREAGERAPRAVVLTGEGAFCAGGDLAADAELGRTNLPETIRDVVYGRFQRIVRTLRECLVPTIAAIDGPAVGLGLDLALACDMRLIGPAGWVQQGWARAGIVAGTGGIGLAGRVRPGLIWDLVVAQGKLASDECARLGVAVPTEGPALAAAVERAGELARFERDVLGHYAELDRAENWPSDRHFETVARIQSELLVADRFQSFAARVLGRA
ncbi:enoyl-CoA hydratase/isomerase family protein [Nocardia fusca]|uniref:enoyl-CoA hydratase/isomerase family protein n=1 Tax=Nocardia fusca TaxID=941183 RepID=UPI00379E8234